MTNAQATPTQSNLKVKTLNTGRHIVVNIKDGTRDLDIAVSPDAASVEASLRASAADYRKQADRLNGMALLADAAAVQIEATTKAWVNVGYLQHGQGTKGPFRTEAVKIRHDAPSRWYARFEGQWRLVHVQVNRTYIVFMGEKITIQIEGV